MPPKHSGVVVTAAIVAARGNLSAAARALGQDPKRVWDRVRRNPSLWPEGVPRLLAEGQRRVSDEAIREALLASGGNQTKAARIVGLSQQGMNARLTNRRASR